MARDTTGSSAPEVWTTVAQSQTRCGQLRTAGRSIGVVPTMGALHDGHLSLVRASLAQCDFSVATIFVNPTQFGPHEDLRQYPRTWDADFEQLSQLGVDAVFAPSVEEMYPEGATTVVSPPEIARPLEGKFRPGHFEGVATIVLKLLLAIPADRAFFGQKDYQQSLVVQAMVRDLNCPVQVEVLPIVREPDGLAMSSRNRYLSPTERERALALYRTLQDARKWLEQGERCGETLSRKMKATLQPAADSIDYAVVVDAQTLTTLTPLSTSTQVVALIAAHVGTTRLIDNLLISLPASPNDSET